MSHKRAEPVVVLVPDHTECVVLCPSGWTISFVCTLPLTEKMRWADVRGSKSDQRLSPDPRYGTLRPLPPLAKGEWQQAKRKAFSALMSKRADALRKVLKEKRLAEEPKFL